MKIINGNIIKMLVVYMNKEFIDLYLIDLKD